MDIQRQIAELENVVADRLIHPAVKYRRVFDQCQQIANIAGALWPPPPEPEPEPRSGKERCRGLLRTAREDREPELFVSLTGLWFKAGGDVDFVVKEAMRFDLGADDMAEFLASLSAQIGVPVAGISELWQARGLEPEIRKRLLCGAGMVIPTKDRC